jgi:hypothetical protein
MRFQKRVRNSSDAFWILDLIHGATHPLRMLGGTEMNTEYMSEPELRSTLAKEELYFAECVFNKRTALQNAVGIGDAVRDLHESRQRLHALFDAIRERESA